jgi:hypothetical protein
MIRNKEARESARLAGLDRFNLGVPCTNGHASERYVSDGKCVACVLEGKKARHAKNPERRAAIDKAYYDRNKAAFSEKNKTYYEKNKEAIAENGAVYREENRDAVRNRQRVRYSKNSAELRARSSETRAARAQRVVNWGRDYQMATREKERELHELCVELKAMTSESYSVDHMIPLMGRLVCGLHVPNNLQVIPEALNRMKINKFVFTEENEWRNYVKNIALMREPSWYLESIVFYKESGWDFAVEEYTSGPYCTN